MARRSSGCSLMSERSADCAQRKDFCSCARNTPAFATSRSSPFRRKGSCAIRVPPNCSTRRSNRAATWSAGCPWYEYSDADARAHIDICFDLAKRHDLDIHMLVDDTDDANSRSLEYLALKTMREGFHGRVTASHCGAMAGYNDVYAAKIIDMVATANVTISANTHINLVCSARLDREP